MKNVIVAHSDSKVRMKLSRKIKEIKGVKTVEKVRKASNFFEIVEETEPDVILIGMQFEALSGLDLIDKLMKTTPRPVLAISSDNKVEKEEAVRSLSYGAIDIVDPKYDTEEIRPLLELASQAEEKELIYKETDLKDEISESEKVVVIGSSTGGPGTLEFILKNLPDELPIPILVAQHMSAKYTEIFTKRLNDLCEFEIKEAEDKEEIENGTVYFAPGNKDMTVKKEENTVQLRLEKGKHTDTPSINELFKSASRIFGTRTIGVILTGMGKDGVIGSKFVKSEGGQIIVQDRDTSKIYGIGKHVVNQGDADKVIPMDEIPSSIIRCL